MLFFAVEEKCIPYQRSIVLLHLLVHQLKNFKPHTYIDNMREIEQYHSFKESFVTFENSLSANNNMT